MSNFKFLPPRSAELKPRIVVFGVGGAGGNAVNNMIEAGLIGVEFVVANTDAQQLAFSKTDARIQLGVQVTQGLGAGAHPEVGMSAAEESIPEIGEHLEGAHMVFITAGMGGGTGTGAAPVIAKAARERGILTVGVVTKPFHFEGRHRMRLAEAGVAELQRYVDTLIVIPNQNLFRIANERTTFAEAFGMADQVLHSGVRSITDLMVLPGLINLDFADVRTVMTEMGKAMMGTGEASGEDRALMAAQNAIQNPLLDEVSLKGAKAVLVNVTGGLDMTLLEVDEACNAITEQVDPDSNIIFGAAFDPTLEGVVRVAVVATGMDSAQMTALEPRLARVTQPATAAVPTSAPVTQTEPASPRFNDEASRERPIEAPVMAREALPPAAPPPTTTTPSMGHYEPVPGLYARELPEAAAHQAAVPQPRATRPAAPATRIIDPMVEEELPLQLNGNGSEERGQGKSWLTLFGGGRNRAPVNPPMPAQRTNRPAVATFDDQAADPAADELEIPSFLRRLAN